MYSLCGIQHLADYVTKNSLEGALKSSYHQYSVDRHGRFQLYYFFG